ncbi:unnamed protein product [Pleuronectes platessa]|uniref:Uncharacterized protein n=1 Tax=Pleuronectes platessa TaxID=8262 RepID=A0A9N7YR64_PLEPL|nr:unnamed protein product [Pleuronectes platessa]
MEEQRWHRLQAAAPYTSTHHQQIHHETHIESCQEVLRRSLAPRTTMHDESLSHTICSIREAAGMETRGGDHQAAERGKGNRLKGESAGGVGFFLHPDYKQPDQQSLTTRPPHLRSELNTEQPPDEVKGRRAEIIVRVSMEFSPRPSRSCVTAPLTAPAIRGNQTRASPNPEKEDVSIYYQPGLDDVAKLVFLDMIQWLSTELLSGSRLRMYVFLFDFTELGFSQGQRDRDGLTKNKVRRICGMC